MLSAYDNVKHSTSALSHLLFTTLIWNKDYFNPYFTRWRKELQK